MIRVGIIGCGRIAQERHLPEYEENTDAQIVGVYDLNQDRAREIAKKYGRRHTLPMRNFWMTRRSTRFPYALPTILTRRFQ